MAVVMLWLLASGVVSESPPERTEVATRSLSHRTDLAAITPSGGVVCAAGRVVHRYDSSGKAASTQRMDGEIRQLVSTPTGWAALLDTDEVVFVPDTGPRRVVVLPRPSVRIAVAATGELAAMVPSEAEIDLIGKGDATPKRIDGPDASTRFHLLAWQKGAVVRLGYQQLQVGKQSVPLQGTGPWDAAVGKAARIVAMWSEQMLIRVDLRKPVRARLSGHPWQLAVQPSDQRLAAVTVSGDPKVTSSTVHWLDGATLSERSRRSLDFVPAGLAIHPTEDRAFVCRADGALQVMSF